jgi:hypothetical protein
MGKLLWKGGEMSRGAAEGLHGDWLHGDQRGAQLSRPDLISTDSAEISG